MKRISHSYYVAMIDYGRRGLEAIVDPEQTRRDVVDQIRGILIAGRVSICFIQFIDGKNVEDVTEEITSEAWATMDIEQYNAARKAA